MLIRRVPWTRQPQTYQRLDYPNPLAEKCIFSWVGNFPTQAEKRAYFRSSPTDVGWSVSDGGKYGPIKAAAFNGSSSYVSLDDTPAVDFGSGSFAVEFLFRTTSISTGQFLLGKDSDAGGGRQLGVSINEESRNGHVRLFIFDSGTGIAKIETPASALTANKWHHVFCNRAAGGSFGSYNAQLSIYVDGVYQTPTEAVDINNFNGSMNAGTSELRIGSRTYTSYFNYFAGDIALVRIYKDTPNDVGVLAKTLWSNVWQLFQPRRIPFPTAAAAAYPVLSNATYTPGSLTTTGFRPRVTAG